MVDVIVRNGPQALPVFLKGGEFFGIVSHIRVGNPNEEENVSHIHVVHAVSSPLPVFSCNFTVIGSVKIYGILLPQHIKDLADEIVRTDDRIVVRIGRGIIRVFEEIHGRKPGKLILIVIIVREMGSLTLIQEEIG